MRGLPTLVMQGRSRATMVATALLMLSLLMPPLSLLSAAVIALVTLRRGAVEGGVVFSLSLVASALLGTVAFGNGSAVAMVALLIWLPVWLLAVLLRHTRSLPLATETALGLGLLVLMAGYVESGDPVAEWQGLLQPFVASLVDADLIESAQQDRLLGILAGWMPGMVAVGFFVQSLLSLFLGRWWQATLYNPGGFREEFHGLRLQRWLALVSLPVVLWAAIGGFDAGFASYLAMLLMGGWLFQGLAVVHRSLAKASGLWLVLLYALLLFAMPHVYVALALLGYVDAWVDFRARLDRRQGPGAAG